jgi:hypothetical protein
MRRGLWRSLGRFQTSEEPRKAGPVSDADPPPDTPGPQRDASQAPNAWLTPKRVTLGAAALVAVSGAALGVGFGLHGANLSARMERQSSALRVSCRRDALTPECVPLLQTAEQYDRSRLAAGVSFGGAALGALVFAAGYWLWPTESQAPGQTQAQTQLRWLPMLGVGAARAPLGLAVAGSF